FTAPPPTHTYSLSLHDALPISPALSAAFRGGAVTGLLVVGLALIGVAGYFGFLTAIVGRTDKEAVDALVGLGFGGSLISVFARRSEEHTSELQSRSDLVCRLLL